MCALARASAHGHVIAQHRFQRTRRVTGQFASVPALRRKAGQGCKVRFLIDDPDSEVTRHREAVEATSLTVSTRIAVTLEQLERLRGRPGMRAERCASHVVALGASPV